MFARSASRAPERLRDLAGQRIAIGRDGSGTQPLARMLLETTGVDARTATLLPLSTEDAAAALAQRTVD
ncbi:MAG: TAXI family TRAP transporter solute-binding subunit, partial [Casimicrobiaceae bacterium]